MNNEPTVWDIKTFEKRHTLQVGGKAWSIGLFENKLIAGGILYLSWL